MRDLFPLSLIRAPFVLLASFALALPACGIKGPLYLNPVNSNKAPVTAPVATPAANQSAPKAQP